MLRRIFGPKRYDIIGGWTKQHNKELHNLCSSSDMIRMIKSRRNILARHVARTEAEECIEGFGGKARGNETSMKI
jgi:hypothetical protein